MSGPGPPTLTLEDEIPGRPPVMCAGCPHRGLFYTLTKNKCTVWATSAVTPWGQWPPLTAMDMTSAWAPPSRPPRLQQGPGERERHKTWPSSATPPSCTLGHDRSRRYIAYNQSNSTVIILDNSITGMTGHQQNPTTGYTIKGDPAGKIDLEVLCRAMGFERVRVVDPYDLKEMDQALKEELAAEAPR